MTSERTFINEVDELRPAGDHSHHHHTREALQVSLATAQSRKANLLTPTYIPTGYMLSRVNISHDSKIVMLVYGNEVSEHHQHGHFVIMQGGSLSPQGLRVKAGQAEAVELQSGVNSHVVRGGWAPTDPLDESSGLSWDSEISKTLLFERSEGLIELWGEPASAWSDSALIQVANSLQPT